MDLNKKSEQIKSSKDFKKNVEENVKALKENDLGSLKLDRFKRTAEHRISIIEQNVEELEAINVDPENLDKFVNSILPRHLVDIEVFNSIEDDWVKAREKHFKNVAKARKKAAEKASK